MCCRLSCAIVTMVTYSSGSLIKPFHPTVVLGFSKYTFFKINVLFGGACVVGSNGVIGIPHSYQHNFEARIQRPGGLVECCTLPTLVDVVSRSSFNLHTESRQL